MPKLADTIVIRLGGEDVILHPSLRHGIRLERRPGGVPALSGQISDGTLYAAIELIEPHHYHPLLANQIVEAGLDTLAAPLIEYVLQCVGIDPDDKPSKGGKTVPLKKHLEDLYRIGTGWLGWTPDTTLDATPAEITLAYEGRLEMLKAIFGSGDEATKSDTPLDDQFKAAFGSVGTVKVKRPKRKASKP